MIDSSLCPSVISKTRQRTLTITPDALPTSDLPFASSWLDANRLTAHARSSPSVSPGPQQQDDLPSFSALTTDEDRERKAESAAPGTFGVVITPESFSDLPEYATLPPSSARRMSVQSTRSAVASPRSELERSTNLVDPNVVVLQRFEDASASSNTPFSVFPNTGRTSLPEDMQRMGLSASPPTVYASGPVLPSGHGNSRDDRLLVHYRQYVSVRLWLHSEDDLARGQGSPSFSHDMFEREALRFPPVSVQTPSSHRRSCSHDLMFPHVSHLSRRLT